MVERIELRIKRLGAQGDGVAETPAGVVFVPRTLPGELVKAEVSGDRGRMLELLEPSADRVTPACPHFGTCGGCAVQHVSGDAYAPKLSTLWGVADYAKAIDTEVIINGNTLENSVDQYISMVQELTIAGPSKRDARFPNFFPSSELTPSWMFPGTKPAFLVSHAVHGSLVK